MDDYKVKLDVFEGPLDLLLYLIKRDEVDIYDISIERITKQYLGYMEAFHVLNIELAGEFIVMAANLLYIKSRTLLPVDQQMAEEERNRMESKVAKVGLVLSVSSASLLILIIRSLSDSANDSATLDFVKYGKMAAENSAALVLTILLLMK